MPARFLNGHVARSISRKEPAVPRQPVSSTLIVYLVDVSDIFYFLKSEEGVSRAGEGGGGGRGAGRACAGNLGGRGVNIFFGAEIPAKTMNLPKRWRAN